MFYYHNDQLGTPNELTNEKGEVVWLADYYAWGETRQEMCWVSHVRNSLGNCFSDARRSDSVVKSASQDESCARVNAKEDGRERRLNPLQVDKACLQPIRFQGQSFDSETGLHYNRFRYYDPDMGMFISRDPIGLNGGDNVFTYAPNPTGWIDPLGLVTLTEAEKHLKRNPGNIKPELDLGVTDRDGKNTLTFSNAQIFNRWYALEKSILKKSNNWTTNLPRCPRKLNECVGPKWGEKREANPEHSPGTWEVRSVSVNGSSNQCVYDANGNIMDSIEVIDGKVSFAPGSADFRECPNWYSCGGHTSHDYLTWIRAKRLDQATSKPGYESTKYRSMYYDVRPILVEKE